MRQFEEWNWTVGEIVAPFGRFGEVKVRLETDFPDRFARLKQVCLRAPDGSARLATVEGSRYHKNQILLKLHGVSDIDAAEALRGYWVQIRQAEAVPLPPNEFYVHTMLGAEVVTAEGRVLGPLTGVIRGPANDVLVVGQGREEILLPAIREVVKTLDVPNRRIVVTPTPGLLPEDGEA